MYGHITRLINQIRAHLSRQCYCIWPSLSNEGWHIPAPHPAAMNKGQPADHYIINEINIMLITIVIIMLKTTTLSVRYVQDKSCLDSSKQSCMMTWFSPLMSVSLLATHGNACCGIDSQFIIAKKQKGRTATSQSLCSNYGICTFCCRRFLSNYNDAAVHPLPGGTICTNLAEVEGIATKRSLRVNWVLFSP